MTEFQPYILGSGMAGDAIAKSLHILQLTEPGWKILPHLQIKRGTPLKELASGAANPLLFIANPAGLHTEALLEADAAGFKAIFCEKPVSVKLSELKKLEGLKTKTAVLHVYRQSWGPQKLREMMKSGAFGEIISVESRYWQPSGAHRALHPDPKPSSWKTDPELGGPNGVLLDLGTHWVDLVTFILGEKALSGSGWASYLNTDAPHRDTHLQVSLDFPHGVRAFGSISKVVHGSANDLDIYIHGTKQSASWKFMAPDEINLGFGRDRQTITRHDATFGSHQAPYHALGWIEGYVEISRQVLRELSGQDFQGYPTLAEALMVTQTLLSIDFKEQR